MTINLEDKVILAAAKDLVEKGKYFDALCLFARVDSYESMLNQIGCFAALNDLGYATEMFRMLLARYYFTHNCKSDVVKLGDAIEPLYLFFGVNKDLASDPCKISADEKLLGEYFGYGDNDFTDEEQMEALIENLEMAVSQLGFCDVKTPKYYIRLYYQMEYAYLKGNFAKGHQLQERFLSIVTDDAYTLERQMHTCIVQRQLQRGVDIALRYLDLPGQTLIGIEYCAQILTRSNDDHTAAAEKALTELAKRSIELTDEDVIDYLQMSSNKVGYGEVTFNWAKILYGRYKDAGCDALMLCARTFFNCGQVDLAREAILMLLRAAPWDEVAQAYLLYLNKRMTLALDNFTVLGRVARHYDIPTQLAAVIGADGSLIKCLFKLALGCLVKGNTDRFLIEAKALEQIIKNMAPTDAQHFFTLAKECLMLVVAEPSLNKDFLVKMVELGYRDKLLVSNGGICYPLDLTHLTICDRAFVSALGIAASLKKVTVSGLQKSFKLLTCTLKMPYFDSDDATVRRLAYALLSITYKRFPTSEESAYFSDEDHALYEEFLNR